MKFCCMGRSLIIISLYKVCGCSEEDQHQNLPTWWKATGESSSRNSPRPHGIKTILSLLLLFYVCNKGDEEGLVRLLPCVPACRPGHRLTHSLHCRPRQHWPQARYYPEGKLMSCLMKHNSLNPDQLQVDSHVLQLAGNGAGAGAMSICPQTSIPGLSYSAPFKYFGVSLWSSARYPFRSASISTKSQVSS